VGRTPWSARVPLDPFFPNETKLIPLLQGPPGGRLRASEDFMFQLSRGELSIAGFIFESLLSRCT
jgi:hypothetical protein